MNDFKCTGRITHDLVLKNIGEGKSVLNFSLAIRRKGKNLEQEADFINATAYNGTAELIAKYMSKGKKGLFEGRICSDTYEKDGKTNYKVYFLVNSVEFLEPKPAEEKEVTSNSTEQA